MDIEKYKLDVMLDLVIIIIYGPFLQVINLSWPITLHIILSVYYTWCTA